MTQRENRALRAFMERLCKQNPSIEAICDGLEQSAQRKLRAQGLRKPCAFPFDPPAGASALIEGYCEALRRIHSIRQALERGDAADAAHHAFFLGTTRMQVLLEQEDAVGKMKHGEGARAARRAAYKVGLEPRGAQRTAVATQRHEEIRAKAAAMRGNGDKPRDIASKLARGYKLTPAHVRKILSRTATTVRSTPPQK